MKDSDNVQEPIGISDGCFAFDTNRSSSIDAIKSQAAERFRQGNISGSSGAIALWKEQIAQDTNDAETSIYLEDQYVAKLPCETVVVVTMLTGDSSSVTVGRSDLQGAYIAQLEYNKKLSSQGACLRLLVANVGSKAAFAQLVARQIVALAKNDHTILGIMGWPFSTASTIEAIAILTKAGISMVSPTASSNRLTGISPYFFRVAPTDGQQGTIGARFAHQILHAKRAVVFVDRSNPYSQTLGDSFYNEFNDGYNFIVESPYTVGTLAASPGIIAPLLKKALSYNPDLIYFAGYSNDFDGLRTLLLSQKPHAFVMGGDGLYELGGYSNGYKQIYLTAFAHPDAWSILNQDQSSQKPPFFDDFSMSFDPHGLHKNNPTDFRRPESDAILSYDATEALITAYQSILDQNQSPTPDRIQHALTQIDGSDITLQGASGQINFGPEGDPVNKTVNVLYVDNHGCSHIVEISGQFLLNGSTAPQHFSQGQPCSPSP